MRLLSIFGNSIRRRLVSSAKRCCGFLWSDDKSWQEECRWKEPSCCSELWPNTQAWNNFCLWENGGQPGSCAWDESEIWTNEQAFINSDVWYQEESWNESDAWDSC